MNQSGRSPHRCLILFGGGIDSCALVAQAIISHYNPYLLYIDYGAKARVGEVAALDAVAVRFKLENSVAPVSRDIIPHSLLTEGTSEKGMGSQIKNEVVGRNVLFASMAFCMASRLGIPEIWIGADPPETWEGFADSRQPTFDAFNVMTAYAYGGFSPRLKAPLLAFAAQRYYLAPALVTYPQLFAESFTCYDSMTTRECGVCNHCTRKARFYRELMHGELYPQQKAGDA